MYGIPKYYVKLGCLSCGVKLLVYASMTSWSQRQYSIEKQRSIRDYIQVSLLFIHTYSKYVSKNCLYEYYIGIGGSQDAYNTCKQWFSKCKRDLILELKQICIDVWVLQLQKLHTVMKVGRYCARNTVKRTVEKYFSKKKKNQVV